MVSVISDGSKYSGACLSVPSTLSLVLINYLMLLMGCDVTIDSYRYKKNGSGRIRNIPTIMLASFEYTALNTN